MREKQQVSIFWFRRDLRLDDNAGLYHALKSGESVLPLFIFDTLILDKLEDLDDARVTFIHKAIAGLDQELQKYGSSILVKHGAPTEVWIQLLNEYNIKAVYTNHDFEPYAKSRDESVSQILKSKGLELLTYKDHVIFEKQEILKDDGSPYTVFTPYKRKWLEKLNPDFHLKAYPTKKYLKNLLQIPPFEIPALEQLGFSTSSIDFPDKEYQDVIEQYNGTRDFPALDGTSRISVHLRFGTISIREAGSAAFEASEKTWLSELIWRDFYAMILWYFPYTAKSSFRREFDGITWINREEDFKAWCEGNTGYPIVDAGMRQLNTTGWMHNRVRMITASFLCKHLLVDWRWGEAYFARKLIDYDMASNVGGWQWAAGTGNDAAPYFRVFSPDLQTKKFDPKLEYVKKWVPEFSDPFKYVQPIVDHRYARQRALDAYKAGLGKI
ncbi:cryptochrome/photolyase family protein [Desertivirga arenae]|uniref:cryptochrome/photolyase family protein n=1 Tax=Desertivirga arenae TaxID=2810309 RepID=UPI001A977418|nr:deoxyribodipyrimidine photo-lyase [Pedobacter sp. SYSU D00823]